MVGTDDLVDKIKEGFLDFDRAVATPSCVDASVVATECPSALLGCTLAWPPPTARDARA